MLDRLTLTQLIRYCDSFASSDWFLDDASSPRLLIVHWQQSEYPLALLNVAPLDLTAEEIDLIGGMECRSAAQWKYA